MFAREKEGVGRIDFANEDFAQGLSRLGYGSYLLMQDDEQMRNTVYNHALNFVGNPRISVWGVRGEHSPYDDSAPDGDELFVDVVSGDVKLYPVLPPGNMGNFEREKAAFRDRWKRLESLERHDTTAPIIDEIIATAHVLSGTSQKNQETFGAISTVPVSELEGQGTDPNAVVFSRLAQAIRYAYANGHTRDAFALASLIPRLATLNDMFWRTPKPGDRGRPPAVKLNLDSAVWNLFENYHGQEARTFQLRALERILDEDRAGEPPLTEQERRRLQLLHNGLRVGYAITRLTAEVTLDDMKHYPSTANPRPDLGVPVFGNGRWLMGGSESGNTAIFYPDGSVYLGDMPTRGVTRVITSEIADAEKLHGRYEYGRFVHIGANGVTNPAVRENDQRISFEDEFRAAYGGIVNRLAEVKHERLYSAHLEVLKRLCAKESYTTEALAANEHDPLRRLVVGQTLFGDYIQELADLAGKDPLMAESLFGFAFSGYSSREDAEQAVGLTHSDAPYDYLMMEWSRDLWDAFTDHRAPQVQEYFDALRDKIRVFGSTLHSQKMAHFAATMPKHPQITEYARSLNAPRATVAQAASDLLDHHSRFNAAWLR